MDERSQISSSLVVIYIADSMTMLLFYSMIFHLLFTPQDYTKIKRGLTFLVIHTPQIELSADEEREGGE